jgi:putative oxidoreductase
MSNATNQILRIYDGFVRAVSSLQSPFLFLFVRLYWGWEFMEDGWGKLHNLAKVTEYFASLNLPAPGQTALFISIIELVGGMLLAVGLFSRLTGLVLTVNMLTAYVTGDREALLSIFTAPDKFSAAAPYMYLFASLVVLIFGPGKFALDTLFDRLIRKRKYSDSIQTSSSVT